MPPAPASQNPKVSVFNWPLRPWPRLPHAALTPLLALLVLVLPPGAHARQSAPGFDQIAANAAAARDRQDLPTAIDLYRQATQLRSDWAEGWFYLGLLQYSANAFPPAVDAFNHFLALQPNAAPALALRGLCEFETGAYDDSLRDLENGIAHGAENDARNDLIIRYHYAQLLTRAGRFQDAVTQYQEFASRKIENPDLLVGLGMAGMRVPAFSKDIDPRQRDLCTAVGAAGYAFLSGDTDSADRQFKQLLAANPHAPELYFFYGTLLFRNSPDLAIRQFRQEVALTPGNGTARAMLAYSLVLTGHYREARPEAEAALAAAPGMAMAQLALGRSLAEDGDPARAAALLNEVLKNDPDNLEAHMGLAALYSRTGRREEAYRERRVCLGLGK